MHPDDVRAGQDRRRDGCGRPPVALGGRAVMDRLAHERLARRPDENWPVDERGERRQPRQHTIAVRWPFGKPDPGIHDDPVGPHAGGRRERDTGAQLGADLPNQIVVDRLRIHRLGAATRVHQHERGAAVRCDAGERRIIT